MTALSKPATEPDPLKAFTLDALLEGAAEIRPNGLALVQADGQSVSFAALARRAGRFASALLASGVQPGETMLLLGGNEIATLAALAGGVRGGVNVLLGPPEATPRILARAAAQTGASLIACGAGQGGIDFLGKGFATAALAEGIRMVATLCGGSEDAADFGTEALAAHALPDGSPAHEALIFTLAREADFRPVPHQQRALVVAALDLIARAHLSASQPIISTLAPHSLAGLVAGPLAALLCGASLHLHGLFDASALVRQIAGNPGARLVVPSALAGALALGGLLRAGGLAGLILRSHWQEQGGDFSPPLQLAAGTSIVDLHSFGERAVVAEPRDNDGRARALLDPPHEIDIGGVTLLAVDAEPSANGALRFFGAGVSETEDWP